MTLVGQELTFLHTGKIFMIFFIINIFIKVFLPKSLDPDQAKCYQTQCYQQHTVN